MTLHARNWDKLYKNDELTRHCIWKWTTGELLAYAPATWATLYLFFVCLLFQSTLPIFDVVLFQSKEENQWKSIIAWPSGVSQGSFVSRGSFGSLNVFRQTKDLSFHAICPGIEEFWKSLDPLKSTWASKKTLGYFPLNPGRWLYFLRELHPWKSIKIIVRSFGWLKFPTYKIVFGEYLLFEWSLDIQGLWFCLSWTIQIDTPQKNN